MERSYIRGIVYSVHDEKQGPWPYAWIPVNLPDKLRERVSWEMINEFTDDKIMEPLVVFPLPTFKMKMLVKHFDFSGKNFRGGRCATTLAVLFNEQDDVVFYRYMRDFEVLFDNYAREINSIQENDGKPIDVQQKIADFNTDINALINTLYMNEMGYDSKIAFPEEDQDSGAESGHIAKFKVIVCGNPAVGKTSLVLRFVHNAFKHSYLETLGVVISRKDVIIGNCIAMLQIWDVAGQAKFNSIRKQFYGGARGAIIMCDITNPTSFHDVKSWYKDIKAVVGNITGILIGNKKDLENERQVSTTELNDLASELGLDVFETSALSGENVEDAFKILTEKLVKSLI
jgi:small GTP-binding protein